MARPSKPSVRYIRTTEDSRHCKICGIATYNRKRVRFTLSPNMQGDLHLDAYLSECAKFTTDIIKKTHDAGVWQHMTASDFNALLKFHSVKIRNGKTSTNAEEIFADGGVFDKWLTAKEGVRNERE